MNMILDVFLKMINLFQKNQKEKNDRKSFDLLIQKRVLFHKDIPSLSAIKEITGLRFQEVQNIINRFDPIKGEKLSEYPMKYELLTKTLIYKLPKQRTRENVADLLSLEFSLWFNHEYLKFKEKDNLVDEIYSYKNRVFRTNPFDYNETTKTNHLR